MSNYNIYKDNYGHDIVLRLLDYNEVTKVSTPLDLNEFVTLKIIIKDPAGNEVTLTATALNDGTDGWLHATTTAPVFDMIGYHKIRAQISNAVQFFDSTPLSYQVFRT